MSVLMGRAYEIVIQALEARGSKRQGVNWQCPAHADMTPSLTVKDAGDRVLLDCKAGCSTEDVVPALGLEWSDLFDEPPQEPRRIADTYPYTDEAGALLFEVVRYYPKDFRQRRPDPVDPSGYVWHLDGTRRVPYHLPELVRAREQRQPVFIVEGERDVHALERAGKVATTNPGGAGKWRAEFAEFFAGTPVAVIADRDHAGRAHARDVARALTGVAAAVQVLEPPEGYKDVTDLLNAGHGLEHLELLGAEDVLGELADVGESWVPLPWQAMLKDGVPEVDYLDPPYFVRAARTWGWGPSGTAKSIFAMWKAAALTRAGHRVVYISEENPLVEDIRRLSRLNPDPDLLVVYHRVGVDLTQPESIKELLRVSEGAAMTVLDSWTDCWLGDENDNRAVQQFDSKVLKPLQDLGVAPLVIHHSGHPGMFGSRRGVSGGRGASSLGQKADVVLEFTAGRKGDIQTFTLSYPKGRVGGEAPPAQLFRVVDLEGGGLDIQPEGVVQDVEDEATVAMIAATIQGSEGEELTATEVRKLAGGRGRQERVMELLRADPRFEVVDGPGRRKLWRIRADQLWETE